MSRRSSAALGLLLAGSLVAAYSAAPSPDDRDPDGSGGPGGSTVAGVEPSGGPSAEPSSSPSPSPSSSSSPVQPTPQTVPAVAPAGALAPIAVGFTRERDRAATTEFGPDGGSLTAAGGDGTTYTLTVPAGALSAPVQIRMTPVGTLTRAPVDALVGAVDLSPGDLALAATATLAITPSGAAPPLGAQTGFAFGTGFGGFHLRGLADGAAIALPLTRFGVYGAAATTRAQRARVAAHPPTGADAAFQNSVAGDLLDLRRAAVLGRAPSAAARGRVADAVAAYYVEQVRPALDAPDAGAAAVVQAVSYLQEAPRLGVVDEARTADARQRLGALLATQLDRELAACPGGADAAAADAGAGAGQVSRLLGVARQLTALGLAPIASVAERVRACTRVRVSLGTTLTDTWDYVSPGETHRLRARWQLAAASTGPATGGGDGPLAYDGFDFDQSVAEDCGPVSRWRADLADSRPGRVGWRLRLDTNLYLGGLPADGHLGTVDVRVPRAPTDALRAATYGSCGQSTPDRFAMTVSYGGDRYTELHAHTDGVMRIPLAVRAGSDEGLAGPTGTASYRLAEPGIDRELAQQVTVRVTRSAVG